MLVLPPGGMNMASGIASELILFIASLMIAGMVAGGLYIVTQDIATA